MDVAGDVEVLKVQVDKISCALADMLGTLHALADDRISAGAEREPSARQSPCVRQPPYVVPASPAGFAPLASPVPVSPYPPASYLSPCLPLASPRVGGSSPTKEAADACAAIQSAIKVLRRKPTHAVRDCPHHPSPPRAAQQLRMSMSRRGSV